MHKLIIIAHPNSHGFSHHIAQTFADISMHAGHDVRILDLYATEHMQGYLHLDEHNKPVNDPKLSAMQEQIHRADELIFTYPVRWYDVPAILKNRFDVNFSRGFAYTYRKGRLLPHRLLKGKTARIFVTAGSPTRLRYTPVGLGLMISMIFGRLFYVGIWTKSFTIFGQMAKYREDRDRKKFLARVERIAKR